MSTLLIFLVGALFSVGAFLMLRPHLIKFAMGLVFFTNGANLLIFSVGRLTRAVPPLIGEGESELLVASANPLSQALVLTAIVIGFGFLAFVLVLIFLASKELGSVHSDVMKINDEGDE